MMAQLRLPALPVRPIPPAETEAHASNPFRASPHPQPSSGIVHPAAEWEDRPLQRHAESTGTPKLQPETPALPPISPGVHAAGSRTPARQADPHGAGAQARLEPLSWSTSSRATFTLAPRCMTTSQSASPRAGGGSATGDRAQAGWHSARPELPRQRSAPRMRREDSLDVDAVPVRRALRQRHQSMDSLDIGRPTSPSQGPTELWRAAHH